MGTTVWHQPENRDDWLALRRTVLTSTEIGALFGLSPYETPFALWWRKRAEIAGEPVREREESERMLIGKFVEPAIAALWAHETGGTATPTGLRFAERPDLRLGCSLDYEATLPEVEGHGILECKSVDYLVYRDQWLEETRDGVTVIDPPHHIILQCQAQLLVTGAAWLDLSALVGGSRFVWTRILPDVDIHCRIVELAADFWRSQDEDQAPPPDYRRDLPTLRELYPCRASMLDPDPATAERLTSACARYDAARAMIKSLEEEQNAAAAEIIHLLGEHEGAWLEGYRLTRRADKRGRRTLRVTAVSNPKQEAA